MAQDGTLDTLEEELRLDHKLIAAVDSGELWKEHYPAELAHEADEDEREGPQADHAIQVIGVERRRGRDVHVILNDPGVSEEVGRGVRYPAAVFLDAWGDSNGVYLATRCSPDEWRAGAAAREAEKRKR